MKRTNRKWVFRLLAILSGLAPLVVLETTLRVFDLPARPPAVDPFVDLHNLRPLFEPSPEEAGVLQIGEGRLNLFQPASFQLRKSEDTFRVFALGGSTTQGEPYGTETAFPAWFGHCVSSGMPDRRVEVINCGGLSYASYRVLAILEEVLQYRPDLILVYTGHNEFLERRSYAGFDGSRWRAQASNWLAGLRLVQLGRKLAGQDGYRSEPAVADPTRLAEEVDALLDYQGGLEDYHRDASLRAATTGHFRWNLNQMVAMCRAEDVPLVLVKPVSNILDCPPMKIELDPTWSIEKRRQFEQVWSAARQANSSREALELGLEALAIDPRHAGANYLVGRLLYENGDTDACRAYLVQAKDYDVCPLCALTYLTLVIEDVARLSSTPLVDAEWLFAAHSPDGIVGNAWLVDHVHPTIEGHQLLGRHIAEACVDANLVSFSAGDWQQSADAAFERQLERLGEDYFQRGKQRLEGLLLWTQGRAKKVRPGQSN